MPQEPRQVKHLLLQVQSPEILFPQLKISMHANKRVLFPFTNKQRLHLHPPHDLFSCVVRLNQEVI